MWKILTGLAAAFILVGVIKVMAGYSLIKSWDKNNDQKLSWDEAQLAGWNRGLFDLKDMDSDGFVDERDLETYRKWTAKPVLNPQILSAMDANSNGQLEAGEGWWWSEKEFKQYDRNKDDVLSPKELSQISKPRDRKLFKMQLSRSQNQAKILKKA